MRWNWSTACYMESSKLAQSDDASVSVVEDAKLNGKKIIFLYSVEEAAQALSGLTLFTNNEGSDQNEKPITTESEVLVVVPNLTKMCCSTCAVSFDNRTDLVEHFKCDFHRFNARRKVHGLSPVSEEAFEDIAGGDISSISGSDSEDSSDTEEEDWASLPAPASPDADACEDKTMSTYRRRQRIFFRNASGELVSIHRCLIFGKKNQLHSTLDVLQAVTSLSSARKWAILMAAGGHFAGALFDGDQVMQHKTFHRYVVRAKRGTAQSQRDKQGNAPRSAGATLRRYNETALTQEIQELLTSWSSEIRDCAKIFLRAPGFNNAIFFGGSTPVFSKTDQRIHAISIQTRRPTFHELKRVHKTLSSIEVYGPNCSISDCITPKKSVVMVDPLKQPESNSEPKERQSTVVQKTTVTSQSPEPTAERIKEESSDDSSGPGVDQLTWDSVTTDTSALKEFDCTKRSRRKKRTSENRKKAANEGNLLNAEQLEIRNRIFTASKTGDVDAFNSALDSLCKSLRQNTSDSISSKSVSIEISESQSKADIEINQVTSTDQNGCQLLQTVSPLEDSVSANDRDFEKRRSEFLSQRFGPQLTTLLHVAARAGHKTVMNLLMTHGADPAVRDAQDQVPYLAATNKDAKNEFRRFMAGNPTKYDYIKAQIPGPLTEEMENSRRTKATEKKKLQKKVKKEKLKEEELEEQRRKIEEEERKAFLAMSDREKRACAAELRFKKQLERENLAQNAILIRCWECGHDLAGIVPFEYYDYKFCSPTCLKQHRAKSTTKS